MRKQNLGTIRNVINSFYLFSLMKNLILRTSLFELEMNMSDVKKFFVARKIYFSVSNNNFVDSASFQWKRFLKKYRLEQKKKLNFLENDSESSFDPEQNIVISSFFEQCWMNSFSWEIFRKFFDKTVCFDVFNSYFFSK